MIIDYSANKAKRFMLRRRIKGIVLGKLLDDLANPEKSYKHNRIIKELVRRYLRPGRHVLLKNGETVLVHYVGTTNNFYVDAPHPRPYQYADVDWEGMRGVLTTWDMERRNTPQWLKEQREVAYIICSHSKKYSKGRPYLDRP